MLLTLLFYLFLQVFDKECKSYIHTMEGASTTTKIQLPKDSKQACEYDYLLQFLFNFFGPTTHSSLSLHFRFAIRRVRLLTTHFVQSNSNTLVLE